MGLESEDCLSGVIGILMENNIIKSFLKHSSKMGFHFRNFKIDDPLANLILIVDPKKED